MTLYHMYIGLNLGFLNIWTEDLSIINNAFESIFCTVEMCTLHNNLFEGRHYKNMMKYHNYTYTCRSNEQRFLLD